MMAVPISIDGSQFHAVNQKLSPMSAMGGNLSATGQGLPSSIAHRWGSDWARTAFIVPRTRLPLPLLCYGESPCEDRSLIAHRWGRIAYNLLPPAVCII